MSDYSNDYRNQVMFVLLKPMEIREHSSPLVNVIPIDKIRPPKSQGDGFFSSFFLRIDLRKVRGSN